MTASFAVRCYAGSHLGRPCRGVTMRPEPSRDTSGQLWRCGRCGETRWVSWTADGLDPHTRRPLFNREAPGAPLVLAFETRVRTGAWPVEVAS